MINPPTDEREMTERRASEKSRLAYGRDTGLKQKKV